MIGRGKGASQDPAPTGETGMGCHASLAPVSARYLRSIFFIAIEPTVNSSISFTLENCGARVSSKILHQITHQRWTKPKDYTGLPIDNLTFWTKTGFVMSRASSFRTLSVSCTVSSKSDSNRDVMGADECICVSSRKCTVPAGDVIFAEISPASTIFKMCPSAAAGSSSPTLLEISATDHG